jgi:hypothetical protein
MPRKRKRISREELHAELLQTNERYRRLAERVEAGRSPAEREAFPLGSEPFSREVDRKLRERIARYEGKRRRASS